MAARGHWVKWLRGTFLLQGVDRVRLLGRHSHTQTNALPGTYAAVLTKGTSRTDAPGRARQSLSRVPIAPLYARGKPASYSCFAQGLCNRPLRRVVPFLLAARLGRSFRFSGGTRFRTRDPLRRNVPPNHFTKWPRAPGFSDSESAVEATSTST